MSGTDERWAAKVMELQAENTRLHEMVEAVEAHCQVYEAENTRLREALAAIRDTEIGSGDPPIRAIIVGHTMKAIAFEVLAVTGKDPDNA